MSVAPAAVSALSEVQCVRLATYADAPGVEQAVRLWADDVRRRSRREGVDDEPRAVELLEVRVPEGRGVVMLVDNVARSAGPHDVEAAARLCRQASAERRLPEIEPVGLTTVLLARVAGRAPNGDPDRSAGALAGALLTNWNNDGRPPVHLRGGPLAPGVELWAPTDDLTRLILQR